MGCCGCDNRTSTTWGTAIAIIQSLVAFILTCYFINIYYASYTSDLTPEKLYLRLVTADSQNSIRALLIVNLLIQIVWGASSVLALVGNQKNNVTWIRQWTIISIIMIIVTLILPAVLFGVTVSAIANRWARDINNINEHVNLAEYYHLSNNYALLVWGFSPGGLITWIANICFVVFANRRIVEILQPGGYIVAPGPMMVVPGQGGVVPQPMYPAQQQMGYYPPQQAGYGQPQQTGYGQPQQPGYPPQQPNQYQEQPPGYHSDTNYPGKQ